MSDKVGQSKLESNGRVDPSQTPSAVIRLVDQSGVQWTYGSIHDVPIEQRSLLSESIVDLNMFESPPNRDPWQPAPESIAAVEIAEPKRPNLMVWLIGIAMVVSLAGFVAAVWILVS